MALVEALGEGLAYRFNNFKVRKLQLQAKEYSQLDKIIAGVKKLLDRKAWL